MNTDNHTPDTITIQLTQGQQTIVSAIDADLAQHKWFAAFDRTYGSSGKYDARRNIRPVPKSRQTILLLHRVIMQRVVGRPLDRTEQVDHMDGDRLNNTRQNLRLATSSQNTRNTGKQKNNTSGFKGVSWHKHRKAWAAAIGLNSKRKHLGYFDTPEAAYQAYCEAAKKYHGEFANFG